MKSFSVSPWHIYGGMAIIIVLGILLVWVFAAVTESNILRITSKTIVFFIGASILLGAPLSIVAAISINILWSPIAALTTAWAARSRGLGTRDYAVKGTCRSLCFVLPWLRMLIQLNHGRMPVNTGRFMLSVVFAGWLSICSGLLFLMASSRVYDLATLDDNSPVWRDDELRMLMQASAAVGFLAGFISVVHWIFALWRTLRHSAMKPSVRLSKVAVAETVQIEKDWHRATNPLEKQYEDHLNSRYVDEEFWKYGKPWLYLFGWFAAVCFYISLLSIVAEYPFLS